MRFLADGCECDGNASYLELDENDEYVGSIACGEEVADLLIYISYEADNCYWRVVSESLSIDESFAIGDVGQSCEEPVLEVDADFSLCSGILLIERLELSRLEPRIEDCDEQPWCGNCECVCSTLCLLSFDGSELTSEELEWDPESRSWGDGAVTLGRDAYTGGCVVNIAGFDPIPISDCAAGISFFARNSMDLTVTGRCKTCTCDEVCKGCCFPLGYDPVFGWFPEDIPFSVSAPNCATANGFTGDFLPGQSTDKQTGACGVCGHYPASGSIIITGQASFVDPLDNTCKSTPCQVRLCFALACVDSNTLVGTNECCGRVRLILGVSEPFVGTSEPPPVTFETCQYYIEIPPSSCTCDSEDGISAVFALDSLDFTCEDFFESGPCYGNPRCCMPISCSLSGATLAI